MCINLKPATAPLAKFIETIHKCIENNHKMVNRITKWLVKTETHLPNVDSLNAMDEVC